MNGAMLLDDHYDTQEELKAVENRLSRCAPLVFAGECRLLHEQLGE